MAYPLPRSALLAMRIPNPARLFLGSKSKKGEIIVLYENGISPIKRQNPAFKSLPKFYPRFNPVRYAEVELNGTTVGSTFVIENIEAKAIEEI